MAESLEGLLQQCPLPKLSEEDGQWLCDDIRKHEVHAAVKSFKPRKSPGQDGWTGEFYKEIVNVEGGVQLLKRICRARLFGLCMDGVAGGIIRLIPKPGKDLKDPGSYRPITLLSFEYKLITKILANRVKKYLPKLISPNQTAFVPGRSIHTTRKRLFALRDEAKFANSGSAMLLVDFSKAYDSVEWIALTRIMQAMDFPQQFMEWLSSLYTTNMQTSILFGATPGPVFDKTRGVFQGCPLSTSLFILVVELLTRMTQHPDYRWRGMALPAVPADDGRRAQKGPKLPMEAFCDDCTLTFKYPRQDMMKAEKCLADFGRATGLVYNTEKTVAVGLGRLCGKAVSNTPFMWSTGEERLLGDFIGSVDERKSNIERCIEKMRIKAQRLCHLPLSLPARVVLARYAIQSMMVYTCSLYLPTRKEADLMDKAVLCVVWAGKTRGRVKRDVVFSPKCEGGMGLHRSFWWSRALQIRQLLKANKQGTWDDWTRSLRFLGDTTAQQLEPGNWLEGLSIKNRGPDGARQLLKAVQLAKLQHVTALFAHLPSEAVLQKPLIQLSGAKGLKEEHLLVNLLSKSERGELRWISVPECQARLGLTSRNARLVLAQAQSKVPELDDLRRALIHPEEGDLIMVQVEGAGIGALCAIREVKHISECSCEAIICSLNQPGKHWCYGESRTISPDLASRGVLDMWTMTFTLSAIPDHPIPFCRAIVFNNTSRSAATKFVPGEERKSRQALSLVQLLSHHHDVGSSYGWSVQSRPWKPALLYSTTEMVRRLTTARSATGTPPIQLVEPWTWYWSCKQMSPYERQILFLSLHRRLATRDRLVHWSLVEDDTCARCGSAREDDMHVRLSCPPVLELWRRLIRAWNHGGLPRLSTNGHGWWRTLTPEPLTRRGRAAALRLWRWLASCVIITAWRTRNHPITVQGMVAVTRRLFAQQREAVKGHFGPESTPKDWGLILAIEPRAGQPWRLRDHEWTCTILEALQ